MKRQTVKHPAANGIEALLQKVDPRKARVEQRWLVWQCQMLASCTSAALVICPSKNSGNKIVLASWPQLDADPDLLTLLPDNESEQQLNSQAKAFDSPEGPQDFISCPIPGGQVPMMLLLKSEHRPASQRQAMIHLLQWGGNCLGLFQREQLSAEQEYSLLKSLFSSSDIEHCLIEMCRVLQAQQAYSRVYFLTCSRALSPAIVSYPPQEILEKSDLSLQLNKLKEESLAQRSVITFPSVDEQPNFKREHQKYSQLQNCALCSIPLACGDNNIGVLIFEKDAPFCAADVELIQKHGEAITKPLATRVDLTKPSATASKRFLKKVSDKKTMSATLLILSVIIAGCLIETDFNVKARAEVEGKRKQLVVAPHDGYIKEAFFRSGDVVNPGELLAQLDDVNLRLKKKQQLAELESIKSQYQTALSKRDRVELARSKARLKKASAEIDIIDYRLGQLQLRSSFEGVVLQGDLNQRLGQPVKAAEVLYEIAAIDGYKVVLYVDEENIALVDKSKKGKIKFSAYPDKVWTFKLSNKHPISEVKDKRNVFRVEAELDEKAKDLKPGLQGYAYIELGKKPILWSFTRKGLNRLRLFFWAGVSW